MRAGTDATALVAETRDELRAAVSLLEEKPDATPGMVSTLDLIIGTWQGVCRVVAATTPDATAALDNDELCRSCLRDVLIDAISNAVRHGDASIVDISISLVGDEVLVRVRDNGATSGTAAIPGLGTRILDECSTRWSSEATDDGYLLTASLPVMP